MILSKDLKEFVELLNVKKVEFLIVGAHAMAFHGVPRYTGDLDLLARVSPENASKLLACMKEFGFGELGLKEADFLNPENIFQFGVAPNRLDILMSISGVDFDEAWAKKIDVTFDGIPVNIIGKEEFIKNKLASGRPKDLADVKTLCG